MDLLASLSGRARHYLDGWCYRVEAPEVRASWEPAETVPAAGTVSATPEFVKQVYGIESGLVLPVLGGDLYGWTRIGPRQPGGWVSDHGMPALQVAQHSEAQCTQFLTLDGRLGVAWPGADLARYSHLPHFIEASAVWTTLHGWSYADVLPGHAGLVVSALAGSGLRLVPEASGELVRWWLGADVAVYAEPQLTVSFDRPPHVQVLAASAERAEQVGHRLRAAVDATRPEYFLATVPAVGQDFPPVPAEWGPTRRIGPGATS